MVDGNVAAAAAAKADAFLANYDCSKPVAWRADAARACARPLPYPKGNLQVWHLTRSGFAAGEDTAAILELANSPKKQAEGAVKAEPTVKVEPKVEASEAAPRKGKKRSAAASDDDAKPKLKRELAGLGPVEQFRPTHRGPTSPAVSTGVSEDDLSRCYLMAGCSRGIIGSVHKPGSQALLASVCCPAECNRCGGVNCWQQPGGIDCCARHLYDSGVRCSDSEMTSCILPKAPSEQEPPAVDRQRGCHDEWAVAFPREAGDWQARSCRYKVEWKQCGQFYSHCQCSCGYCQPLKGLPGEAAPPPPPLGGAPPDAAGPERPLWPAAVALSAALPGDLPAELVERLLAALLLGSSLAALMVAVSQAEREAEAALLELEIGPEDSVSVACMQRDGDGSARTPPERRLPHHPPPPAHAPASEGARRGAESEERQETPVVLEAADGTRHEMAADLDGAYTDLLGEVLPPRALRLHARLLNGGSVPLTTDAAGLELARGAASLVVRQEMATPSLPCTLADVGASGLSGWRDRPAEAPIEDL
ncbi:hypothetical protein EMIHUDRAFT_469955 [Emiliania huxleyi CCMP1516]|uniref:ShKT domain-containing protein n=2 Tax=Emiliania huxleyi TaxID=2903 RepID=A0A0D3JA22_EMIH1|nr:hypothetical protein EMIHUDRAFT_469955 [Emiliania huxleyi CCMP1516]EOD20357.1 hypothetical protein EMIHUDRAFT_469955 [Emiliania huxleyi CCMP1516]|eukprot:XP_005772786.1 hypothetical protein EMIHUDRAFT_469955 [Emiliania huxleyi CCMP1516]